MTDRLCQGAGRIAILGFFVSMLGSVATAQNVPGDIPGMGAMGFVSIQSVAIGDGEMVYAGSFGAGVFKSDDGGKTWQAANEGLNDPFVYVMTVAPDKSVFAGTLRGGIFRSHNQGKNWAPVNVGLERLETHVLVHHQGTLYAGTGSGVYRSSNGGESWVADNEGLKNLLIRALAIDPEGTMYVGTTGMGIYRKRAGLSTKWMRITATQLAHPRDRLPENFVRALVADGRGSLYAGTADNGVYVSGDRGDSWRAHGTGVENASIRALAITGSTWFVGTGQGMYRSVDRGKTWVSINAGLLERSIQSLAVGKDGLAYAGTSSGIFKTEDHGAHWSPINLGLGTTPRILGPQH
jgi:ligand-binding sensor domain-containing protein